MGFVNGVNLLPSTGEFTYATTARLGQRVTERAPTGINFYFAGGPPKTDYSYAIDQLQAAFPACTTVAVVCAWFGNSVYLHSANCQIYPSTTYVNNGSVINPATGLPWPTVPNAFQYWNGSSYTADHWRCSSLDETSPGIGIAPANIPQNADGSFIYGGTPSDQSIVECINDLKARGLRVVFYPFILMTSSGKPWRGRITYSPDVSGAAASAVGAFLGGALTTDFVRDFANKTVIYNGPASTHNVLDFTYRRMVLHYANLCVVAGGVDLFLIGSELRGLETIRGPGWTPAGTVDGGGKAIWDYPFVAGLITLSDDVRSVFDGAGLAKDTANLHNLISYAADWSDLMGWQHPGANPPLPAPVIDGQWPHLDQLWAHSNIDLVCFDNYLPVSDWTTGFGSLKPSTGLSDNLDIANWSAPAATDTFLDYGRVTEAVLSSSDDGLASDGLVTAAADYGIVTGPPAWPPPPALMSNLGLSGTPTLYSKAYLKANIEGGEKFNWFYSDSKNLGRGNDPLGSDLQVSLPEGDRLAQLRASSFRSSKFLATSKSAGGGTTPIRHCTITATDMATRRRDRRRNGSRKESRSCSPSTASRRATRRRTSRRCSLAPDRRKVLRRSGRHGAMPTAAASYQNRIKTSSSWRSRQSTNIGSRRATTRCPPPA
jgi:hypothetical protein